MKKIVWDNSSQGDKFSELELIGDELEAGAQPFVLPRHQPRRDREQPASHDCAGAAVPFSSRRVEPRRLP